MLISQNQSLCTAALRDEFGFSLVDYQQVFESLYANQYFTNHGPLAQQFEQSLQEFLGVEHVVVLGSKSLAMLVAFAGLEVSQPIVVPVYPNLGVTQTINRIGLDVSLSDVNRDSHQPTVNDLDKVITNQTETVVLIETWGNRCDQNLIDELISRDIKVVVVGFDSFAARTSGRLVHQDPNVVTVLSFGPGSFVCTLRGGAVATNNEDLAHKFRNIRSSYGVVEKVGVAATCNGRFSEAQAGLGMLCLDRLEDTIARCSKNYGLCLQEIEQTPILNPYQFNQTDVQNNLVLPLIVKEDGLLPNSDPYPVAKQLSASTEVVLMNRDLDDVLEDVRNRVNRLDCVSESGSPLQ